MSPSPIPPSEEQYLHCILCRPCPAFCPAHREHLSETQSPRGRVAPIHKGLEGDQVLSSNLIEQIYVCFDCLACIDGVDFVELHEADWCCRLAGTQLITHYDTLLKVLKCKTDNLAATQAGYVASGCPACQMQMNVGMRRAGLNE